jgi:hypothetical protein
LRVVALGTALLLAAMTGLLAGCTTQAAPPPGPVPTGSSPENVIDFVGLPQLTIGSPLSELTAAGLVATAGAACGPNFPSQTAASPVFADGALVLIWAYPPLHTPEDVMVGTPVDRARNVYPGAEELTPPAGSHQYRGLLVLGPDDLVYLLLHDGSQVQKLIVGVQRYARLLVDTGFGAC